VSSPAAIATERLLLRPWHASDLAAFAEMNADPAVMEHFPAVLGKEESDALASRIQSQLEHHGWGLWAVEIPRVTPFAGFIGLDTPEFDAHFTPCTEIGWRLARAFWGRGYASEGAEAVLEFAFDTLGLDEIVSFTSESNVRSRRVMERIGMSRNPLDDFDHPRLPHGHALRRHVLYRIFSRAA
jgi:RimJ/RimL family protein N-acetyltransferase